MAHAAEGLYAEDRNPISTLMAAEGLAALHAALPGIVADPRDIEARSRALYGAWLCGTVLGSVSMALHHKLCHTLGGSFDLPHAETHAVLLPHTVGFNAVAVPDLLRPVDAHLRFAAGRGALRLRRIARRADRAPRPRAEGGRPRPRGGDRGGKTLSQSTTVRRGRDPRIARSGLGRRPARNMTKGRKP